MNNIVDLNIEPSVSLTHFEILRPRVCAGDSLDFTFTLENASDAPVRLNIRYEIEYPWQDRHYSYKISNKKCPAGFLLYNRSHTIPEDSVPSDLRLRSPRKKSGSSALPCRLHILVNGQALGIADFWLLP